MGHVLPCECGSDCTQTGPLAAEVVSLFLKAVLQGSESGPRPFVRRAKPHITIDTTPTHQVRRIRLRAHHAARRAYLRHGCLCHGCLRQACLRHACLRDACHASIVSSHVVSARVKRAAPLAPRRHRPACLPARCAATPRPRDSSNQRPARNDQGQCLPSTLDPAPRLTSRLSTSSISHPPHFSPNISRVCIRGSLCR